MCTVHISIDVLQFVGYLIFLIFCVFICLQTAVVQQGKEELHLVAMTSRKNPMPYSCFWGFSVPSQLYESSLLMLNLRCLGIVFDLDETLLVANTMRSFEDRIEALQRKINNETDPQRIAGMLMEIKRYQDDKSILKQYAENDQVNENGRLFKVQSEMVPPLSDSHQLIARPVIRLQEKNIILTRVNPSVCFLSHSLFCKILIHLCFFFEQKLYSSFVLFFPDHDIKY